MNRREARELVLHLIFAGEYSGKRGAELLESVNEENIASLEADYAVGWNVARISRISKCILRLSRYEVLYMGIPVGASVNEALELAKQYDSPEAAGFINGIMGAFVKQEVQA